MSDPIPGAMSTNTAVAGSTAADANATTDTTVTDEKKFTQSELDHQIKERLARQQRQFEAQAREAQAALEAKQLEDQAEWQKLANQRAEQIKELKPRAGLAEVYEKGVKALVDVLAAEQPSNIQSLLDMLPLQAQLDWMAKNISALKPQAASGSTNTNAYNRSASPAVGLTEDEYREKKRRELNYH